MMPRLDKLLWNIAADSLAAVCGQVEVMVAAAASMPAARDMAAQRIVTLRQFGERLCQKADDLEAKLNADGELPPLETIASDFEKHFFPEGT